jgi:hypothetical protein
MTAELEGRTGCPNRCAAENPCKSTGARQPRASPEAGSMIEQLDALADELAHKPARGSRLPRPHRRQPGRPRRGRGQCAALRPRRATCSPLSPAAADAAASRRARADRGRESRWNDPPRLRTHASFRYADLTSPKVAALTDREFRAFFTLAAFVAIYGSAGEFPRSWLRFPLFGHRRRVTPRLLERFAAVGLIEEYVYADNGSQVLQIVGWRDWQPVDPTSAERKRRFRQRIYSEAYRDAGVLGKVVELDLAGADTACP